MCGTCGCGDVAVGGPSSSSHHHHDHDLVRVKGPKVRRVSFEQDLLARNDALAAENRAWLAERRLLAVNVTSSPGAGKTTLLERTLRDVRRDFVVIEGDQATELDAERIRATGTRAVQVNTGAGCHLDAAMVARALRELDPPRGAIVLVENVGNLVCPALFDLGEAARVVVASIPEGDDKPAKYPHMFRRADLVLLNKVDLAPYVRFDRARFSAGLASVGARAELLEVSATRGDGLDAWYAWLERRAQEIGAPGARAAHGEPKREAP